MSEQSANLKEIFTSKWQGQKQIEIAGLCFAMGSRLAYDKEKNTIEVAAVLDDGVVEGGQKVHMILSSPTIVPIEPDSETLGYQVTTFTVNGFEQLRGTKFYLKQLTHAEAAKVNPLTIISGDKAVSRNPAEASTTVPVVLLSAMAKGDDLVAFYHEYSHLLIPHPDINLEYLMLFHHLVDTRNKGFLTRFIRKTVHRLPPLSAVWQTLCTNETTANKLTLKLIKEEKEAGNNMFPHDTSLYRVKKFLGTNTLTYLGALNGAFAKRLGKEELRELAFPDFDI